MCKTAKTSSILLQILNWGHQDASAVHGSAAALWAAHRPLWGREHRATNPTPHTHPAAAALGLGSQHRTLQDSWFQFTLATALGFRGAANSKPGARQPGSPSQAGPSHVVFLIKGWSVAPMRRSTDCRVELAVGCRDSTGCQGQGGHEAQLHTALLWAQHIQLREKQPQEPARVPAVLLQSCTQKSTGQKEAQKREFQTFEHSCQGQKQQRLL